MAQLVVILGLALVCLNVMYGFEGFGNALRSYQFVSRPLMSATDMLRGAPVGNRFAGSWLGYIPVPLPRKYVEGIDLQWHDIEVGKPSYLRGGWWYWYLYALAVKVPLGTWGLLLLAVAARWSPKSEVQSHRRVQIHTPKGYPGFRVQRSERVPRFRVQRVQNPKSDWRDEVVLLAPAVVVLVLVSSQTGFSRYIRYVLPMFPFVFIWISSVGRFLGVRRFIAAFHRRGATLVHSRQARPTQSREAAVGATQRKEGGSAASQSGDESPHSKAQSGDESPHSKVLCLATLVLLAWSVGSSLWYAPHWMSYFNELAGGPMGGPEQLIDAQVDWGQDLLYLKKWLDAHPEARPLGLVYFGPLNPTVARVDFKLPPKGTVVGEDRMELARLPEELTPGWYAVSVNFLYGYPHYIYDAQGGREWVTRPYYSYFRRFQPAATAGYSIYIYQLPAHDIQAAMD